MRWITQNWFTIIVFLLMIGMHLFGHGMHGGPGRRKEPREDDAREPGGEHADHEHGGGSEDAHAHDHNPKKGHGCC